MRAGVLVRDNRRWIGLALAALCCASRAQSQGIASPGPLSSAHVRLDDITRCLACHEAGRELSGRRCLQCHVSLARRIAADRGFHADATRHGAALACGTCHSEHNGRPYRLVRWEGGQERFDHARTGFALEGAHPRARCTACHRAGLVSDAAVRADSSVSPARTFLGLGTSCAACHLDEHRGRVSRQCETCHEQTGWKPVPKFDHAKTRFPLTGRHATVACAQCHANRRETVSGPGGARDTSFIDFRAGRAGVAGCTGCHTSPHRDRARMARCESCHSVMGWFVLSDSMRRFDHAPTGFPLRGAHDLARCESCHLPSMDAPLPAGAALVRANFVRRFARGRMDFARCDACHQNPHAGELVRTVARDCDFCHDESHFTPASFGAAEHDSTAFPLTGAHRATPCSACHQPIARGPAQPGRVAFRRADTSCTGCHRDPHGGQFAPRTCEACHATSAWTHVTFDHERTRYPLRGAHRTVACARCHTAERPGAPVRFSGLPTSCEAAGCHGDPHGGQFADRARGAACTTCHGDDAWHPARFNHQTDADWPLDGAHQAVACASCHPSEGGRTRWRPLPHRCEDCHAAGRRP